ncbi:MAG: SH3 domain-containing protein [Anaerolineae bacterium]|nr:SH3 domain-containing protein [Anaerolineae bacterium]MDW8172339.1 SH3 domain-containing protein [Anaerolineae bacterium]
MKHLALSAALCLSAVVGWSLAQTPAPTPTPALLPSESPPCIVTLSDDATLQEVLIFNFRRLGDALRLPGLPPIACNLTAELAASLDRSPSVGINQAPSLALPVDPTAIAQVPGYAIVNARAANLRSGPGVGFTRVGVVRGGDNLIVLGQNERQTWWYVQTGDLRGWISNEVVLLRGDLSRLPVIQTVAEITPATLYVGFTGNPLYGDLDSLSPLLCLVQGRMEHLLLGISFNKNWYVIEATCTDGSQQIGWLSADAGLVRNPAGLRIPVVRQLSEVQR